MCERLTVQWIHQPKCNSNGMMIRGMQAVMLISGPPMHDIFSYVKPWIHWCTMNLVMDWMNLIMQK